MCITSLMCTYLLLITVPSTCVVVDVDSHHTQAQAGLNMLSIAVDLVRAAWHT